MSAVVANNKFEFHVSLIQNSGRWAAIKLGSGIFKIGDYFVSA